eukprot:TRINITY_DN11_c0_g1_i11.p1 TRINITY_DN11_c0_g1~~TRINITY_DN11_c0_g1_i11.p1  ORF type:complete len:378 (+),score=116.06 TRINITY_DN11_c0_g1_i11:148-1134(+)
MEGNEAEYTIKLDGTLEKDQTSQIDFECVDINTNADDFGKLDDKNQPVLSTCKDGLQEAVDKYTSDKHPGSLIFDGTKLTWTADEDGQEFPGLVFKVPAIYDTVYEGGEDYQPTLKNPVSTTGNVVELGNDKVVTKITDTTLTKWSISGDETVSEGNEAKYTIKLDGTLEKGQTSQIDFECVDISTNADDFGKLDDKNQPVLSTCKDGLQEAVDKYTSDKHNVDTVGADLQGSCGDSLKEAVDNYPDDQPGSLTFDGTKLTWTADTDGQEFPGLVFKVPAIYDTVYEGGEDYQPTLKNPGSTTGNVVHLAGLLMRMAKRFQVLRLLSL